ncbi:protein kinase [Myxococcaceae bacterium JPH2]|nr:protein kinase [Myxococcaceae bacterium JPH2]
MAEVVSSDRACAACGWRHGLDTSCDTLVRPEGERGAGTPREPVLPEADPLLGTQLGSFRLTRRVGRGGMGSVYLGEHVSIGSRVAVKVLHEHLARYPELVSRFHAEARAVNLIGHENIVSIFDLNAQPPRPYLIMEYLEGAPLSAWVGTPLPCAAVVPVLAQVCDALHAAHARGIVHRDLKPDNVFMARRGRGTPFVKVLDFGIAKLADAGGPETHAGIIVGTPEYMAPEQASSRRLDGRADLYSLGVIAYQLVTGQLPFPDEGLAAQLVAHQVRSPPSPRELCPSVPIALERVILRTLAKAPEDRYPTASALRAALQQALSDAGPPAARPSQAIPSAPPAQPRPSPAQAPGAFSDGPARARPPLPVLRGVSGPASPLAGLMAARDASLVPWNKPEEAQAMASTPARARATEMSLRVVLRPGETPMVLTGSDLSRGGLFLHTGGALPAMFSRVEVLLPLGGEPVPVLCEVVRHVSSEQARAWSMPPGFGVQFTAPSPGLRAGVERLLRGDESGPALQLPGDDGDADRVLAIHERRLSGDHYTVLGLAPDADMDATRARARGAWASLEALRHRPLSRTQLTRLATIQTRVREAGETLGLPVRRALYDARLGNPRGVARCLEAGLTATQLEALRREHLAQYPHAAGAARVHFLIGSALERDGQLARALEAYERGLARDPLELELHQRYRVVRRALAAKKDAKGENEEARPPGQGAGLRKPTG